MGTTGKTRWRSTRHPERESSVERRGVGRGKRDKEAVKGPGARNGAKGGLSTARAKEREGMTRIAKLVQVKIKGARKLTQKRLMECRG